ncbi:MAG: polysaccharide deacetylase family protein [Pyrinomonadaceae bacterium]
MPLIWGTNKDVREVAFTFDDGPNPNTTPKLLDILAANNIKAVFFVVGNMMSTAAARSIVKRAFDEGHHIGNHSFSHPNLKTLSEAKVRDQVRRTHDLISDYTHDFKFFRPPYGATNTTVNKVIHEFDYQQVLWSVDTMDWKFKTKAKWVDFGMNQIKSREDSIVLMHDIHPTTVNNVQTFITKIEKLPKIAFVQYG